MARSCVSGSLDLWPIGNCQVSALVDTSGRFVWACLPRVDGDPAFSSLLNGDAALDDGSHGFWDIQLVGVVDTTQSYLRNTAVLVTRHSDARGNAVEITDFCPRYQQNGRMYRPAAFVRIVRPIAGSPRIRVRLRPSKDWGAGAAQRTRGSNHIRYEVAECVMRLSTTAPVGWVEDEAEFRVERPLHFFFGPDESFSDEIAVTLDAMLDHTIEEWRHWVRGLATPPEWQEAVIRSAITLKLCQHEESGAIVAAMTTSIP